jgi:hypothetical protein
LGHHGAPDVDSYFFQSDGTESTRNEVIVMLPGKLWSFIRKGPDPDNPRGSWSVCYHLSSLEGLFDYYMASGSVLVLLGKCFCHDCYEMVLSRRDLTEFMDTCWHMTDKMLQEDLIDPLFQINREVFKIRQSYTIEEKTQWTWTCCPHVCKEGQLEELYTKCNPIFFHEGFVTCNECRQVIPSASLYLQSMLNCEAMTDAQLQQRIIDQLFPINRAALGAVGFYGRQRLYGVRKEEKGRVERRSKAASY